MKIIRNEKENPYVEPVETLSETRMLSLSKHNEKQERMKNFHAKAPRT